MTTQSLALISAEVKRVLGEYDHYVSFAADDQYVIVYGPNGVGKTKFLEIIHHSSRFNGSALVNLPFESAILRYTDGTELNVSRNESRTQRGDDEGRQVRYSVTFTVHRKGSRPSVWEYFSDEDFDEWLIGNTSWRPFNEDLWEDRSDGELASLTELVNRYQQQGRLTTRIPPDIREFREKTPSFLIETQRLRIENYTDRRAAAAWRAHHSRHAKPSSKITEQAQKMQALVNAAQTEHSQLTQQLDRTFPNRVLEHSRDVSMPEDEVRARYDKQNKFRSRLARVVSVPLVGELSLPGRPLVEWEVQLLNLYLIDADKKLAPFGALLRKIELLEKIINSRLMNKRLRITAKAGIEVLHAGTNGEIALDSLSSGEQHEIILMFDLLFNVPEGALVLIDEPEISLHVVWQLAFIPDVQKIAELAGFRMIVATHSPQIINDDWERAIRLGPPEVQFL
ncbi:AAA family ATPase [Nocardia sp. NPDC058176]|uniref:AAA family ATPase n=1 Tax=Nocardia sp. NPDC058176 TaxID=3346368 RepID=UPI0036DBFD1B